MNVKIWPRSINERGGIACLPIKKNIPEGKTGWKLTICPKCGRECWETPLFETVKKQGVIGMCTECALRAGMQKMQEEVINKMMCEYVCKIRKQIPENCRLYGKHGYGCSRCRHNIPICKTEQGCVFKQRCPVKGEK